MSKFYCCFLFPNKSLIVLLLVLVFNFPAFSQSTISGYVRDQSTGESLYGASVFLPESGKGANTNFDGFFSVKKQISDTKIRVSFIGYTTEIIELQSEGDTLMYIDLSPNLELDEVVVSTDRAQQFEKSVAVSNIRISKEQLNKIPAVGGEMDVIRAVQMLPGVQSGKEGLTGLYVRGGGPDQNLILLDGVPLYNISHLGGIFSLFNPDIISDVELIKGGFPARYGGRLSSVLNIKVKDGNRQKRQIKGAAGLVSSRLSLEGPIKNGKGSYLIAGRRTYLDLFTRPITRISSGGDYSFGYNFYDLNAKVNYDLSSKDRVFISAYSGHDKGVITSVDREAQAEGRNDFSWGNLLFSGRWTRRVNEKLYSNLSVGYTHYRFDVGFLSQDNLNESVIAFDFNSGIRDINVKYEIEYYSDQAHTIRSGVHYIRHRFSPGVNAFLSESQEVTRDTTYGSIDVNASEISVYLEDEWRVNEKLSANIGVHVNNYLVNEENYLSLQPRVTARYMLDNTSSIKAAFASMQQNVHLLSSTGIGLPVDLWVPATDLTRPQQSFQWTLAYNRRINSNLEFSAETFYKGMTDLIAYSDGINWLEGDGDWQEKIERNGIGRAYGLELLLQKKEGKFSGWIGYTLARTELQFPTLNEGQFFPDRFDRRHDIGILLSYDYSKNIIFSLNWVYGTGEAITIAQNRYLAAGIRSAGFRTGFRNHSTVENYEGRNSFRMRAFHRADIGVRFIKTKKWGERTWNLGFYNAYSRANPFYYYWRSDISGPGENYSLRRRALFPIIPGFSYEFKLN